LSVDLDGDVIFVQVARDLLVVEGLLFHHVTPMAGGVTDREQDRAMQLLGRLERLIAPWIPLEWVVSVLTEVGGRLEEEPVGVLRRAVRHQMCGSRLVIGASSRPGNLEFLHQRLWQTLRSGKGLREIGCGAGFGARATGTGGGLGGAWLASGRARNQRA